MFGKKVGHKTSKCNQVEPGKPRNHKHVCDPRIRDIIENYSSLESDEKVYEELLQLTKKTKHREGSKGAGPQQKSSRLLRIELEKQKILDEATAPLSVCRRVVEGQKNLIKVKEQREPFLSLPVKEVHPSQAITNMLTLMYPNPFKITITKKCNIQEPVIPVKPSYEYDEQVSPEIPRGITAQEGTTTTWGSNRAQSSEKLVDPPTHRTEPDRRSKVVFTEKSQENTMPETSSQTKFRLLHFPIMFSIMNMERQQETFRQKHRPLFDHLQALEETLQIETTEKEESPEEDRRNPLSTYMETMVAPENREENVKHLQTSRQGKSDSLDSFRTFSEPTTASDATQKKEPSHQPIIDHIEEILTEITKIKVRHSMPQPVAAEQDEEKLIEANLATVASYFSEQTGKHLEMLREMNARQMEEDLETIREMQSELDLLVEKVVMVGEEALRKKTEADKSEDAILLTIEDFVDDAEGLLDGIDLDTVLGLQGIDDISLDDFDYQPMLDMFFETPLLDNLDRNDTLQSVEERNERGGFTECDCLLEAEDRPEAEDAEDDLEQVHSRDSDQPADGIEEDILALSINRSSDMLQHRTQSRERKALGPLSMKHLNRSMDVENVKEALVIEEKKLQQASTTMPSSRSRERPDKIPNAELVTRTNCAQTDVQEAGTSFSIQHETASQDHIPVYLLSQTSSQSCVSWISEVIRISSSASRHFNLREEPVVKYDPQRSVRSMVVWLHLFWFHKKRALLGTVEVFYHTASIAVHHSRVTMVFLDPQFRRCNSAQLILHPSRSLHSKQMSYRSFGEVPKSSEHKSRPKKCVRQGSGRAQVEGPRVKGKKRKAKRSPSPSDVSPESSCRTDRTFPKASDSAALLTTTTVARSLRAILESNMGADLKQAIVEIQEKSSSSTLTSQSDVSDEAKTQTKAHRTRSMLSMMFKELESFRVFLKGSKDSLCKNVHEERKNADPKLPLQEEKESHVDDAEKVEGKSVKTVFRGSGSTTEVFLNLPDFLKPEHEKNPNICIDKEKISKDHTRISLCLTKQDDFAGEKKQDNAQSKPEEKAGIFKRSYPTYSAWMTRANRNPFKGLADGEIIDDEDVDEFCSAQCSVTSSSEDEKRKVTFKQRSPTPPRGILKRTTPYMDKALGDMKHKLQTLKENSYFNSPEYYERALRLTSRMTPSNCRQCGCQNLVPSSIVSESTPRPPTEPAASSQLYTPMTHYHRSLISEYLFGKV